MEGITLRMVLGFFFAALVAIFIIKGSAKVAPSIAGKLW